MVGFANACRFATIVTMTLVMFNLPQILYFFLDEETALLLRVLLSEAADEGARVAEQVANGQLVAERLRRQRLRKAAMLGADGDAAEGGMEDLEAEIKSLFAADAEAGEGGEAAPVVVNEAEGAAVGDAILAQAQFADGIKTLSAAKVSAAIARGADVNDGGGAGCPLYQLAGRRPANEMAAVKAVASLILAHPMVEPNGDGSSWTPLKTAIANRNIFIADLLLEHPRTISEVEISGLDCAATKVKTKPLVTFVIADSLREKGAVPQCFASLPSRRVVSNLESKLMAHAQARRARLAGQPIHNQQQQQMGADGILTVGPGANFHLRRGGGAGGGFGRAAPTAIDPRNPFVQLPPGVLPPRDTIVMNPTAFSNIYSATLYYFVGPLPALWVIGLMGAAIVGAFALATMTLQEIRAGERHRQRLALEAEAEAAKDKKEREEAAAEQRKAAAATAAANASSAAAAATAEATVAPSSATEGMAASAEVAKDLSSAAVVGHARVAALSSAKASASAVEERAPTTEGPLSAVVATEAVATPPAKVEPKANAVDGGDDDGDFFVNDEEIAAFDMARGNAPAS